MDVAEARCPPSSCRGQAGGRKVGGVSRLSSRRWLHDLVFGLPHFACAMESQDRSWEGGGVPKSAGRIGGWLD